MTAAFATVTAPTVDTAATSSLVVMFTGVYTAMPTPSSSSGGGGSGVGTFKFTLLVGTTLTAVATDGVSNGRETALSEQRRCRHSHANVDACRMLPALSSQRRFTAVASATRTTTDAATLRVGSKLNYGRNAGLRVADVSDGTDGDDRAACLHRHTNSAGSGRVGASHGKLCTRRRQQIQAVTGGR